MARTMAIPSTVILLTEAAPAKNVLGTVHGAGNMLAALARSGRSRRRRGGVCCGSEGAAWLALSGGSIWLWSPLPRLDGVLAFREHDRVGTRRTELSPCYGMTGLKIKMKL